MTWLLVNKHPHPFLIQNLLAFGSPPTRKPLSQHLAALITAYAYRTNFWGAFVSFWLIPYPPCVSRCLFLATPPKCVYVILQRPLRPQKQLSQKGRSLRVGLTLQRQSQQLEMIYPPSRCC